MYSISGNALLKLLAENGLLLSADASFAPLIMVPYKSAPTIVEEELSKK